MNIKLKFRGHYLTTDYIAQPAVIGNTRESLLQYMEAHNLTRALGYSIYPAINEAELKATEPGRLSVYDIIATHPTNHQALNLELLRDDNLQEVELLREFINHEVLKEDFRDFLDNRRIEKAQIEYEVTDHPEFYSGSSYDTMQVPVYHDTTVQQVVEQLGDEFSTGHIWENLSPLRQNLLDKAIEDYKEEHKDIEGLWHNLPDSSEHHSWYAYFQVIFS